MPLRQKILVVDDDPQVLSAYREVLVAPVDEVADLMELLSDSPQQEEESSDPSEREVVEAKSAAEAISLVENAVDQKDPFTVIFIDIRMPPGMDGVECAVRLKEIDRRAYIVLVSAYADYSLEQIRSTPLEDRFLYLRKPFIAEELNQIARTLSCFWERDRQQHEEIERLRQQ